MNDLNFLTVITKFFSIEKTSFMAQGTEGINSLKSSLTEKQDRGLAGDKEGQAMQN